MNHAVHIIGAGLAGSEAALTLAKAGVDVVLFECRPDTPNPVHKTDKCAELVCSNSLKSLKPSSAAGMLKSELSMLHSPVYEIALKHKVAAGGALAVNRDAFAQEVSEVIVEHPHIRLVHAEVIACNPDGTKELSIQGIEEHFDKPALATIICAGPLASDRFASWLRTYLHQDELAFYDAAAPIVMADSIDHSIVFSQSRYEEGGGDYLNAPFNREQYEAFILELLNARRVIQRDFETTDLFQACQPIEEIARSGFDAPRFGPLKPVGLTDPRTGKRPWACVQLRAEDEHGLSFNLVGFQTNLTFPEQKRVFRMIPGLEEAEFARYGVMHRNTFINAPHTLDTSLRVDSNKIAGEIPEEIPELYICGQISGTEGYTEAIRSGHHAALSILCRIQGFDPPELPRETAFGALLHWACDVTNDHYQPMHVNHGIQLPLDTPIRSKQQRYEAYADRAQKAMESYTALLKSKGVLN